MAGAKQDQQQQQQHQQPREGAAVFLMGWQSLGQPTGGQTDGQIDRRTERANERVWGPKPTSNYGQEARVANRPVVAASFCALNWVGRYLRNMLLNNNGVRG